MNGGHVVLDTPGMVYERSFAYFDDVCKKKREARNVEARHKIEALPRGIESKGLQGDKRVESLRYLLENGFVDDQAKRIIRSREQRQLHEVSTPKLLHVFIVHSDTTQVYIRSCLPKLYQNEWEDSQERILNMFGIDKLQQEALVVMPRRSGKTWSMAMFCAAMLIVCSDIEISVFATGQRTASKLLKLMTKMMGRLLEFINDDDFKIIQQNKESVILLGPDKTERICGCYPGSVTVSVCVCGLMVVVLLLLFCWCCFGESGRPRER